MTARTVARLAAAAIAAATVLLSAAPAHARPDIAVGFDSFPAGGTPASGTRIEREFQSRGIYFLPGGLAEAGFPASTPTTSFECGLPPTIVATGLATSPPNALGPSRCIGGGPVEFPDNAEDILGVFTTYRSRVSLRIGPRTDVAYSPPSGPFAEVIRPWDATLIAYDVNYNEVARDEIRLRERHTIPAGLHYTLSVASPKAVNEIAFIYVRGPYAASAPYGAAATNNYLIDDLTFDDPDVPPAPNLVLGQNPSELRVRRGATATRTFSLLRFNDVGASVDMSVSGLPAGIVASGFSPDPTTGNSTTLTLAAGYSAAEAATATVTASGAGFPTRSASLPVRIVDNFSLSAKPSVKLPACRKVDLGVHIALEQDFTETIDVRARLRESERHIDTTVSNGGKLYPGFPQRPAASVEAHAKDRPADATVEITAHELNEYHDQIVTLEREKLSVTRVTPAVAPQELAAGRMTVSGRSFCPDVMKVTLDGLPLPVRSFTQGTDGYDDVISIDVPRDLKGGTLEVTNTANGETAKFENVGATTWRNTHGFAFGNYPGFRLSFNLLQQVFGDQVMLRVNACSTFTFGFVNCGPSVKTGFPSPTALLWIAAMNAVFATKISDDAHCFGMSLTAAKLRIGRLARSAFPPAPETNFLLDGPAGPLGTQIAQDHLRQFSADIFKLAVVQPAMTPAAMRDAVRAELSRGRPVPVSIRKGAFAGHTIVIYDITDGSDGGFELHVYDPNKPARIEQPTVTVTGQGSWSYAGLKGGWSGGMPTIRLIPVDAVPDKPQFIDSLRDVLAIVSGSLGTVEDENGKAVVPKTVPVFDQSVENGYAALPSGGIYTLHTRATGAPYDIAVQGGGVMTRVKGIRPPAGVRPASAGDDELTFNSRRGSIALDPSAGASPLDATITATVPGGAERTAHVRLARADGSTIGFDRARRALQITHRGPATTLRLQLGEAGPDSAPDSSRFQSVALARGQTVTLRAADWRNPKRVAMRVVKGPGKGRTRTLHDVSRAKAPVTLGKLAVSTANGSGPSVTLPVRFGKLAAGTTANVALLVSRGKRVVARHLVQLADPASGASQRITLQAKKLGRGRYRVRGVVVVVTPGAPGLMDSASKARSARFSVR